MRYTILLVLSLLCTSVWADSWRAANVSGMASPSGHVVVRVIPSTNLGEVYGFAVERKGKPATAVYYRLGAGDNYVKYQEVSLLNPIAPIFFAVSDASELVTLDNWHNMGIGKTVVVYRADGQVLRSYELGQIYTVAELQNIRRSVSSIWWRCSSPPFLEQHTSVLEFEAELGFNVEVNLKTGVLTKSASSRKAC
jgi:hypothetical protein